MISHLLAVMLWLPFAPPPCSDKPCALAFDWGAGKTAGDYSVDLRYGPAADFENAVRRVLTSHGARLQDGQAALTINLRPALDGRAMCDETPGTSTSYSCRAVSDVTVRFAAGDPALAVPAVFRVSNRCGGATKLYARMRRFGEHTGEMIWWTLFGKDNNEKKPSLSC